LPHLFQTLMHNHRTSQRLIGLILAIILLSSPLLAQQRRSAAPKKPAAPAAPEPAPTFDSLLSADAYKIYCEIRGVGGLIHSPAVNDLLDPLMKLGGPPDEFKTVVKWLNAHADLLAGSRMLVAGWPSKSNLPKVLIAIEFSSSEEAKKFYPELRGFLPTLLPTPTPVATTTPGAAARSKTASSARPNDNQIKAADPKIVPPTIVEERRPVSEQESAPAPPPYEMRQVGTLILISDTAFKFRNLRSPASKPLEEDPNFTLARNRFASESLFLYVDVASIEREEKDRRKEWEEVERKRIESEAANPPKAEPADNAETEIMQPTIDAPPPPAEPEHLPSPEPTPAENTSDAPSSNATLSGSPQPGSDVVGPMMFSFYGALFGGQSKWPEAVSAAVAFEGDAYVLRALIVNSVESRSNAIPFVPQFVSGPALVPESPNIFPADADLFVSVSLDYPQIYEGMLKAIASSDGLRRKNTSQPVKDVQPLESPFAIYEKKLGLKIKDDLFPLLGNELALALLKKPTAATSTVPLDSGTQKPPSPPDNSGQKAERMAGPNPVVAISVKDREAVGRLLPKIIESFGFKGANLLAQTEKRDGTEITSYGNVFSYAFVGDFLVVSPNPAATRSVVEAYLNHQTLSSASHFRNFTRWQPRQVLGQVYVAPGLVQQYTSGAGMPIDDKLGDFLSQVNPVIDPLTYALSNDGQGPLHELHLPKNLVQLLIAGMSRQAAEAPVQSNETVARSVLHSVAGAEASFQADKGKGHYGTLDELVAEGLFSKELIQRYGYTIELTVSGNKFEAIAIPIEYGKSGRLSYFIDESGVLRAGDHGGGAATVADQPLR
jgi:hypothetical protein